MIKRRDVFMKVQEKYPIDVSCYVRFNYNSLQEELCLGVYKKAPEEVQLIVKSARKFYKLVEV